MLAKCIVEKVFLPYEEMQGYHIVEKDTVVHCKRKNKMYELGKSLLNQKEFEENFILLIE